MIISRTITEDKRVATDFRHLNVRIAKNNLACPLLQDTFSVLGSSRCEVLSVLDLKDAFHSLKLLKNSKRHCGILPYCGNASYFVSKNAYGIKYITINLAFIHKHNFVLFTKQKILWSNNGWSIIVHSNKKSLISKLKDLLRALLKNGLMISPKKCQLFRNELQYMDIWEILYSLRIEEYV